MGGRGSSSKSKGKPKGKSEAHGGAAIWGAKAGAKGGGVQGTVWFARLLAESSAQGLKLEALPDGFKLTNATDTKEIRFLAGFNPLELPANLNQQLGLEIISSPGLQRVLVEEQATLSTIKKHWNSWTKGRAKGRYADRPNFTRYMGSRGYRVSVLGERTPLTFAISGYNELDEKGRAAAILATTEPKLIQALPERLQRKLADLLAQPNLLADRPYLEEARKPLVARVNALLGYEINSLDEFELVVSLIQQNPSRGAVGETFFRRFLASPRTASQEMRKPEFKKELYGGDKSIQPDILRPASRRTLDVKVGYSEGDIGDDQLDRYVKLVRESKNPNNATLRQELIKLGVVDGTLAGHDYLFLPNGKGKTSEAAVRAFNTIRDNDFSIEVAVQFVEPYINQEGNTKIGIYQLEYDETTDKIIPKLIGERLPD